MKTEKKIISLLATMFPISVAWWPFSFIKGEYDLFLFYELEQSLAWYASDTAFYLNSIILGYIIFFLTEKHYPNIKTLSRFFFIYAILRLVSYWLFRDQIPLMWTVSCATIYCLMLLTKYYGKNNNNRKTRDIVGL